MSYVKQTWIDNETPLDAEHMNHIEEGIEKNDKEVSKLSEEIAELKESGGIAGGESVEQSGVMVVMENTTDATLNVRADTSDEVTLYHSGKNLIPPYTGEDATKNGVTIVKNADGTVTISGTPTTMTWFDIAKSANPIYLPAGDYTLIPFGFPSDHDGISFAIQGIESGITKSVVRSYANQPNGFNRFTLETGDNFKVNYSVRTVYDGEPRTLGVVLARGDLIECQYEPYKGEKIITALPVELAAYSGQNILYTDSGDVLNVTMTNTMQGAIESAVKKYTTPDYDAFGLPVLRMTGDDSTMTKDDAVNLAYTFAHFGLAGTVSCKWQGTSSIKHPKKNFTLKFDQEFEAKEGWGAQTKYCAKANWIDFLHFRNVGNAILWGMIVASRKNVNTTLAASPNYGAVDGFPIIILINDQFQGVYTFNIPKDGWMANMGGGTNECILCADGNNDICGFKGVATLDTDFGVEYITDKENMGWAATSLNNLISACVASDGSDLDTTIATMLDWESAIDYWIFTALIRGDDMILKNYLLDTCDGTKWIFGAYDMDCTYGLRYDGKEWLTAKGGISTFAGIAARHRVFELIKTYKLDVFKARYQELRSTIMSEDNVITTLRNLAGQIPRAALNRDNDRWPTIPNTATNTIDQIAAWYPMRCAVIDAEVEAMK